MSKIDGSPVLSLLAYTMDIYAQILTLLLISSKDNRLSLRISSKYRGGRNQKSPIFAEILEYAFALTDI